jgi:hypothetical protein
MRKLQEVSDLDFSSHSKHDLKIDVTADSELETRKSISTNDDDGLVKGTRTHMTRRGISCCYDVEPSL